MTRKFGTRKSPVLQSGNRGTGRSDRGIFTTKYPVRRAAATKKTTGKYCGLIQIEKKKVRHKEHKDHQGKMVKR
jgi:hypothetical protein